MNTLAELGTEVAEDYFKRDDMAALATKQAAKVYQLVCSKVPFEALQTKTIERPVSATDVVHSLVDVAPEIAGIMSVRMTFGSASRVRRLTRSNVRLFDQANPTMTGDPSLYARFGNAIEFNTLPRVATYTYRIRYWSRPTMSANAGDTPILCPYEWRELLFWETVYRVYLLLDQHEKAMMLVQPAAMPRQATPNYVRSHDNGIIPRLWNDLLLTIQQREAVDEEYTINPISRRYTA